MRRRLWQVELRSQGQCDGMDRLGQMVRLVIDHADGREHLRPRNPTSPAARPQVSAEPRHESQEVER